ncbi:MAG: hypothetical protein WBL05_08880 [Brooklawnia sp.]|uniref:hypothetical protein n=1 Tax=Brooklawnia sp. TaxID=2699740 RepID=UPI003C768CA2
MSALQAPVVGPRPTTEQQPTPLRAVPGRSTQQIAQLPFVLFIAVLLGLGMAGVLVLSTTIQTQSAELSSLQAREAELRYQEAALVAQVQDLRSSARLADRAWKLGMRPNPRPAFIRLPDGQVVGVPTTVTGDELAGIVPPATAPIRAPEPVAEPEPEPDPAEAETTPVEPEPVAETEPQTTTETDTPADAATTMQSEEQAASTGPDPAAQGEPTAPAASASPAPAEDAEATR